ncbi:MAG: asparagine synthase (glutamine-hydrolyzing), partial [Phycisphaerae bacterium]
MCGIAGIIRFDGGPIDPQTLWGLCNALAHRGPDDRGIWSGRMGPTTLGLAHTRLAVIDPSPAGHQPMSTADRRCWIAFNGEIYNYRQLRCELAADGLAFRTDSDTEVILQAYRRWGTDCFRRFNGMWALVLIDLRRSAGMLVRDRFGIKPLYYIASPDRLIFASEMAALLHLPDWPRSIDPAGLNHYLRLGFVPQPRTILQAVRKLGPGQLLPFDHHGLGHPQCYYRLQAGQPCTDDYATACRQIRHRLAQAVAARTIAHVPLGAFLSGGIDSSIVVAQLAHSGAQPVRTYSIGYIHQPRYDETRYARLL